MMLCQSYAMGSFVDILGTLEELAERGMGAVLLVDLCLDWLQLSPDLLVREGTSISERCRVCLVCFLDFGSFSGEFSLLLLDPCFKIGQFLLQDLAGLLLQLAAHSPAHLSETS